MTLKNSWSLCNDDREIHLGAHVLSSDPATVRFILFHDRARSWPEPRFQVRRSILDVQPPRVVPTWADDDPAEAIAYWSDCIPAVLKLATWLPASHLVDLCRANAEKELATATAQYGISVERKWEARIPGRRDEVRIAHLTLGALSLDTPAARSIALQLVPTFTGTTEDLAMVANHLSTPTEDA